MNNFSNNSYDKNFKILLLGDCSVGKTCFLLRYVEDTFTENHITTIGVDYKTKIFEYTNGENNNPNQKELIKLQVWDTAGQDKFRCITKNYFRGSNGILLIYDITSPNSFKNIKNWVSQITESLGDEACIVLVGNKVDLENDRKISKNLGEGLANEYKMNFFETSAKENMNISQAFSSLVNEMMKKYNSKLKQSSTTSKKDANEKSRSLSTRLNKNKSSDKPSKKKKWC